MRGAVDWAREAWTSDLGLSALACLAFAITFILQPIAENVPRMDPLLLLSEVLFALIVITAIIAVTRRVWPGLLGAVFMITLLSVRYASQFDPRLLTAQKVLAIVPQLVLMLIVMALSLRAGPIGYQRVAGAVLTYLLVARVWARLYALLAHLVPGAIVVANGNGNVSAEPDLVYFSIMTLTTAGYGDIVPGHPVARALASLEAIVGVLFPVVYLSRFVSTMQRPDTT